jgi:hypothetical protein
VAWAGAGGWRWGLGWEIGWMMRVLLDDLPFCQPSLTWLH